MARISIIMPVYNTEQYVKTAIQSVLNQTYTDWELILVNDASTDNSLEILKEFQRLDKRIQVIDIPQNSGASHARNIGMKLAKGDYLSFLDSDDFWDPIFLISLISKIEQNTNINFIYSGFDEFDEKGNIINVQNQYKAGKFNAFIHKSGELRFPFDMDSFMVKRELIEKFDITFPEEYQICEDTCFLLKILCITPAYYVPEILTHYRKHTNSATTSSWSAKRWESTVLMFKDVEKYCPPSLAKDFKIIRSYRAYSFISSILKHGNIDDTIFYTNKFSHLLSEFLKVGKKINNRIKCYFILKRNRFILKIVSFL